MSTVNLTVTFVTEECCRCHMPFALPSDFYDKRRKDHGNFYCPRGHGQHYTQKSEVERLKAKVLGIEADRDWQRSQLKRTEASNVALRGVVTRKKNQLARVASGVCPCCKRSFKALRTHMEKQHPNFAPHIDEPRKGGT